MEAAILVMLALGGSDSHQHYIGETCSIVEVNHYFDGTAKNPKDHRRARKIFSQVMFYEWAGYQDDNVYTPLTHLIYAWRLVRTNPVERANAATKIHVNRHRRGASVVFVANGALRRVRSLLPYRETWTLHDPELADRGKRPQGKRRNLIPSTKPHR